MVQQFVLLPESSTGQTGGRVGTVTAWRGFTSPRPVIGDQQDLNILVERFVCSLIKLHKLVNIMQAMKP